MPTLHIELQEGFQDDTVVVRVDGAEVLRKERVKTRLQTGFAAAAGIEVKPGSVAVEVSLPAAARSAHIDVTVNAALWLGVSLAADRTVHFTVAQAAFGYV